MTKKAKVGQHMSVLDLADILKIITVAPMTARHVSEQHKCGLVVLRSILRCMVQLGVAHVSGWDHSIRGTPAAIFAGGAGESVKAPKTRDGLESQTPWGKGVRARPSVNMILFADLIHGLDEGGTVAELTERTGCNPATATKFVNHVRRIGLAHVGAWHQNWTGYPARVFMLGSRRDVPRPKPMSVREKSLRQYYARKAKAQQETISRALSACNDFRTEAA
jgi:hypothetical protein